MAEIDSISERILLALRANGRITNLELAKQVGLSASACLRRVQELERSGIILGYKAVIDKLASPQKIVVFVMVGLSAHLKKDAQAFERAMEGCSQVIECHNIAGNVEYLLRVEVSSLEAFKAFHTDVLGVLPQVSSINSHFCLGTSKDARY